MAPKPSAVRRVTNLAQCVPEGALNNSVFQLTHLNRGFGVALAAFDRLQKQGGLQKPAIFPQHCLRDFRNRTQELRAVANRDLLRLFAGREDHDAIRSGRLRGQPEERSTMTRRRQ